MKPKESFLTKKRSPRKMPAGDAPPQPAAAAGARLARSAWWDRNSSGAGLQIQGWPRGGFATSSGAESNAPSESPSWRGAGGSNPRTGF